MYIFSTNKILTNSIYKILSFIIPFILLLFFTNSGYDNDQYINVLSYNVWNGFQEFQSDSLLEGRYIEWVKDLDPDIIAYQEMNHFTQKKLENFASKYGHRFAVILKESGYPVALTSKYPIVDAKKVLYNMHHGYLYANINGMHVFAVHFSPHDAEKRKSEVETVVAHAEVLPDNSPIIIAGDFNALSPVDSAIYDQDYIAYEAQRDSMHSGRNNVINGNFDYSVIKTVRSAGFKDSYTILHSDFKSTVSTPAKTTNRAYQSNRRDYIWLSKSLSKHVTYGDIIHDDLTDRLSDHYPLFVKFKFLKK